MTRPRAVGPIRRSSDDAATLRLSPEEARRVALLAQRLAGPRPRADRRGIVALVGDLGYLQLDPTNVVARNPLLVLWSRLGPYDPELLDDLLFRRRELFETVSLIVPTSDLGLHVATMRKYRRGATTYGKRAAGWIAKNAALRRSVLARLRRGGPLPLIAFEDRAVVSWTSSGWTSDRNVSQMLTFLQRRGEVVVAGRRRGQKLWALADGRFPMPGPLGASALAQEGTSRAMRALGIATPKQLRSHYAFARYVTPAALAALERDGVVLRAEIGTTDGDGSGGRGAAGSRRERAAPPAPGGPWYVDAATLRRLRRVGDRWERRTTLLSPFDNLIIDRDRTERLFGLRYRMEIYVPPLLRQRGFWAMPILHDDRLIGTVDPRFERERGELVVNGLRLEPDAPRGTEVGRAVRAAVEELASFVGARRVVWAQPATFAGGQSQRTSAS